MPFCSSGKHALKRRIKACDMFVFSLEDESFCDEGRQSLFAFLFVKRRVVCVFAGEVRGITTHGNRTVAAWVEYLQRPSVYVIPA